MKNLRNWIWIWFSKRRVVPPFIAVVPLIIYLGAFLCYPLFQTILLSFRKVNIPLRINEFVGIQNYLSFFASSRCIYAMVRTFLYTTTCVGTSLLLGIIFALLTVTVSDKISDNFSKILRIFIMLPMLLMPAASSVLWTFSLTQDYGWINSILGLLGITPRPWLVTHFAFYWVMFVDIWSWTPYMYLIIFAGFQSLPVEPLEAARVDGASPFQLLIYLILPLVKPVILIALILKTIDTYKAFDYLWIMTNGGPGDMSTTLNILLYKTAFYDWEYGKGCAMGILMILLLGGAILPFLVRRREIEK